jgi:hypothetical protein
MFWSLSQRGLAEMETVFVVAFISAFVAVCIATFFIVRMSLAFYRLHGRHKVVCPDNGKSAVIKIRTLRGALTSVLDDPEVFVRTCSRWPEKRRCPQECVESILGSRER